MKSICCTVMSTSYAFLPSTVNFPNLSQWTYFYGGNCANGTITISESRELVLWVVGIKYGR